MTKTILQIDASARTEGSTTRALTAQIVAKLGAEKVIHRDLATPLPVLSEAWVGANFTAADQRSAAQKAELALSDVLVGELQDADTLVIGVPVYNFSVPANLKAWVDLVARAGVTFSYGSNGPEGLLKGKRAVLAVASGGTTVGSEYDFATGYLRHVLGFIGITDVAIIAADAMVGDAEGALSRAREEIAKLAA